MIHRRAAVWWGYCCLLTLAEELEANPAVERDIADIGASKEPEVPEWAQVPPEEPAEEAAEEEELLKELKSAQATVDAELKKLQAMIPPHIHGQHHADH